MFIFAAHAAHRLHSHQPLYCQLHLSAIHKEGITVFDSEFERSLFDLRKTKLAQIEDLGQAAYPQPVPRLTYRSRGARQVG